MQVNILPCVPPAEVVLDLEEVGYRLVVQVKDRDFVEMSQGSQPTFVAQQKNSSSVTKDCV